MAIALGTHGIPGDGCSAACGVEPGYTYTGAPSVCATACGDGVVAGAETCDDAVTLDDAGRTTYRHFGMRRNVAALDQHPDLRDFLKACASETRQKILFLFVDGAERTVGQIADQLHIVPSTASEHLAILKRGGLLDAERGGKEVYYRPNRARILALLRKLTELLSACCPE